MTTFREKLNAAARRNRSLLCVGLDIYPERLPCKDVADFNCAIIEATADLVCAYKPNLAFYEALGMEGLRALERTLAILPGDIPVIGDGKRGDIGSTAQAYARAMFDVWGFDAVTLDPYMGREAVEPFAEYTDRGVFVLCRTSGPGSADFQTLRVNDKEGSCSLYEVIAQRVQEWDVRGNLGLVVGATYPQELERVRHLCPRLPILVPGVGPQGGDLEASVRAGLDAQGYGVLINASRQVLYASGGEDFAQAARQVAQRLQEAINRVRQAEGFAW